MAEIALELNVSEEFVKKKIQSLRSTYIQEKKKIYESKTTGTGSDDVYSPSLYWFHELDFLQDVIVPRKTTSNLENNTQVITFIINIYLCFLMLQVSIGTIFRTRVCR